MTDSKRSAGEFYTRYARLYDRIATDAPFVETLRRDAIDALAPSRGDVVVGMGCGTGANFPALREAVGPEGAVVGVDLSRGVLDRARDRIERAGWENVHVVRGDATRPPLAFADLPRTAAPAGEADCVVASFVSGMVADPERVVHDWCRIVGDGGRIGLFDLARSTSPVGRPLNPAFGLFVRASTPPARRLRYGRPSPTRTLDERVRDAHRAVHARCQDATTTRRLAGFVRITAGTVDGNAVARET